MTQKSVKSVDWHDLKYLAALSIPATLVLGLWLKGGWAYLTPIYAFVLIPILEILMPHDTGNFAGEARKQREAHSLFDLMLYINIPLIYGLLIYCLYLMTSTALSTFETIGFIFSLGIVLGTNGINVGHEMGHRRNPLERFFAKTLLLPSFYMHFYIEHNFGHHLHAATKEDPATAIFNQSVYSFWFTSVTRQYMNAWRIQRKLLAAEDRSFLSLKNDMLWYTVIQTSYAAGIYLAFGGVGLLYALSAGIVGFLLLETVNYIEHYGLLRQKLPSGRYERVKEIHSWNSNHVMGRIVLYELTRHSDHHYKSARKYQVLDNHETSPQMPYGYPTSMVLSLMPPLWFKVMNSRIPEEMIPAA